MVSLLLVLRHEYVNRLQGFGECFVTGDIKLLVE